MSSSSSVSFNGFDHTRQQVRAQQSSPAGSLSSSQSTARTSVSRLTSRQRQNSQLTSTIFQSPLVYPRMMNHLPMDVYADKTGETFFAEWPVQNAQALKAHIEDTPSSTWTLAAELENDEDWPRALKGGIVLGGGWYTVELARTYPHPHTRSSPVEEVAQTLAEEQRVIDTISLYISATSVQNNAIEIEYPATIFVGIKTTHTNTGAKYGETQYIWTSNTDFEFTKECEFHAIELPKISHLLQNPDVLKDDGFSICVHIASPMATKQSFTMPNEVTIPRRIIDSLASLVDSTTGDVKFLCLEHVLMPISPNPFGEDSGVLGEKILGETHHLVSRKRVLYAHSEILKASGDYFNGLLTGGFAESSDARRLDTNHVSIIVDDASFETVYWMLKFIYTNSLLFAENENVRLLTEHMQNDRGEARRRLTSHALPYSSHSEWEYSRLPKDGEDINDDDFDAKTIKSTSSVLSALSSTSSIMGAQGRPAQTPVGKVTSGIKGLNTSPSSGGVSKIPRLASPSSTPPRRRAGIQPSASLRMTKSPPTLASPPSAGALMSAVGSEVSPTRVPAPAFAPASSRSNKKASPSSTRNAYLPRGVLTQSDPHSHPCASPAPASALAVYMLSHRYSLDSLEELARDHILAKMTPGNCMPMLLATYRYDQLHAEVLDFVIDHWTDVQISIEFLKCVQEVSSGAWGEEGGLVLHGLFKRL